MSVDLKNYDSEQKKFIKWMMDKNINENVIKLIANKRFSTNKMWALLFAVKNKISPTSVRILTHPKFSSTEIYKVIDALNDKLIDDNFLLTFNFELPFNIQFAIYKKNSVLSEEWKNFIITLFPKDITLFELEFLINFIDEDMDLNIIKKYIKKPKDINYFVNLFMIVKNKLQDDEFLKLILRENPNYNKTVVIIDLKKHVDNQTIKSQLLKLNVRQLYLIQEMFDQKQSQTIISYLFSYKCKISNVDEIEILRNAIDNSLESKNISENILKIIFDLKFSPQKTLLLSNVYSKYKIIDILKFAAALNFVTDEDYNEVIKYAKSKKINFSNAHVFFKPHFKIADVKKQIDNIEKNLSEGKLLDFVDKVKNSSK